MDNAAIVIAIISATATVIGGSFATWQQLKKDRQVNSLELHQLKRELETDLWGRAHVEFEKMQARLDDQDATIQEQGGLIMQLRQTIQEQNERIKALEAERDNWKSRALAAEGAKGKRL